MKGKHTGLNITLKILLFYKQPDHWTYVAVQNEVAHATQ